ncbi:hypothetical protein [Neorhodopirellula lusitana]|uniref:hypothetical protein n=1 Tax=Neorhodopirellula lusitana TaxID=445327 RepID=UPI00384E95F5
MQFRRDYLWSQGFGVFTTDGSNSGMPIDAYVGWMHTFSAPFYVLALFVLYRLSRRFPVDRDDQAGAGRP